MKLYKEPAPPYLMRVNIKRFGDATEHLTICETTQEDCCAYIKRLIEKQKLSPFQKGKVTSIEIREAHGSDNGKSVSLSFKGLSPLEVQEIILLELE